MNQSEVYLQGKAEQFKVMQTKYPGWAKDRLITEAIDGLQAFNPDQEREMLYLVVVAAFYTKMNLN